MEESGLDELHFQSVIVPYMTLGTAPLLSKSTKTHTTPTTLTMPHIPVKDHNYLQVVIIEA